MGSVSVDLTQLIVGRVVSVNLRQLHVNDIQGLGVSGVLQSGGQSQVEVAHCIKGILGKSTQWRESV
ncbi:hypothetical protein NQD34_007530, partial [Periophthalmus magnuspinnatus]